MSDDSLTSLLSQNTRREIFLPDDIWITIAQHLHPSERFSLCCLSKLLNSIFNRSSHPFYAFKTQDRLLWNEFLEFFYESDANPNACELSSPISSIAAVAAAAASAMASRNDNGSFNLSQIHLFNNRELRFTAYLIMFYPSIIKCVYNRGGSKHSSKLNAIKNQIHPISTTTPTMSSMADAATLMERLSFFDDNGEENDDDDDDDDDNVTPVVTSSPYSGDVLCLPTPILYPIQTPTPLASSSVTSSINPASKLHLQINSQHNYSMSSNSKPQPHSLYNHNHHSNNNNSDGGNHTHTHLLMATKSRNRDLGSFSPVLMGLDSDLPLNDSSVSNLRNEEDESESKQTNLNFWFSNSGNNSNNATVGSDGEINIEYEIPPINELYLHEIPNKSNAMIKWISTVLQFSECDSIFFSHLYFDDSNINDESIQILCESIHRRKQMFPVCPQQNTHSIHDSSPDDNHNHHHFHNFKIPLHVKPRSRQNSYQLFGLQSLSFSHNRQLSSAVVLELLQMLYQFCPNCIHLSLCDTDLTNIVCDKIRLFYADFIQPQPQNQAAEEQKQQQQQQQKQKQKQGRHSSSSLLAIKVAKPKSSDVIANACCSAVAGNDTNASKHNHEENCRSKTLPVFKKIDLTANMCITNSGVNLLNDVILDIRKYVRHCQQLAAVDLVFDVRDCTLSESLLWTRNILWQ